MGAGLCPGYVKLGTTVNGPAALRALRRELRVSDAEVDAVCGGASGGFGEALGAVPTVTLVVCGPGGAPAGQ